MAGPLTDNLTSPRLVTSPASPVRPLDAPRRAREGRWQFLVSYGLRSTSGSVAMLAAIRRASSRVSSLVARLLGLIRAPEASRDPGQRDADNQRCNGRRRGQQEKLFGKHPTQPNFPITHFGC